MIKKRIKFQETTWENVKAGDTVLVARSGYIQRAEVQAIDSGSGVEHSSVLATYTVDGRTYYAVPFRRTQPAFIEA